jgi:drug/metabolite transporter (DMT)-like permease
MNNSPYFAYLCLASGMTLVGVYVGLSKPLVAVLPVFLLAWLRFAIAALAMLPWLRKPAGEMPMNSRTQRLVFWESFLGNFMFSICMLYGVSMTSAVAAGVIMASIPACVALMSWAFLGERVGKRTWAAVACAVIGISLVSLSKVEQTIEYNQGLRSFFGHSSSWLGNALVFGAVLCEASYVVIGKRLSGVLSPRRISSLINLWGLALVTPLGVWQLMSFDLTSVSVNTWALLVFYALAASMFTVWLWMTGLKTVPAAQAGVFTVMLPIAAAATGVLLLGEKMNTMQVLAFAIALLGVWLATWRSA